MMENGGWQRRSAPSSILDPLSSRRASSRPVSQERDHRIAEVAAGRERVELGAVRAVRFVQLLRVAAEFFEVALADEGGLAQLRAFAFQAAQADGVGEGELDLVVVQHAQ